MLNLDVGGLRKGMCKGKIQAKANGHKTKRENWRNNEYAIQAAFASSFFSLTQLNSELFSSRSCLSSLGKLKLAQPTDTSLWSFNEFSLPSKHRTFRSSRSFPSVQLCGAWTVLVYCVIWSDGSPARVSFPLLILQHNITSNIQLNSNSSLSIDIVED